MKMTLAELYTLLEGVTAVGETGKSGADLIAAIKNITAEMNTQEKNLRTRSKSALEALGLKLDSETLDDDIKNLKAKLDAKGEGGDLAAKVDDLTRQLQEQTETATKAKDKATGMKKKQAVLAALSDAKVKHPDLYVDLLCGSLDLEEADDGDKFTLKVAGKSFTKIGDGVTEWLKDKTTLVDNPVKGGGGSGSQRPGAPAAGGNDENQPLNPGDKLRQAREAQQPT